MIVDVEVFYDPSHQLGSAKGFDLLRKQIDEAGIDRAIVFPRVDSLHTDNEGLLPIVAEDPRFIPCASINPHFGEEGQALFRRAVTEWGYRGLKLMPVHYAFRSAGNLADPLIRIAEELNVPVTIHSGNLFCHPLEIAELAARFPKVTIIMDHMGYRYHVHEAVLGAERCPNLYLATTAVFEPHFIRMAVQRLGAGRVVFGSNGPLVIPRHQIEVIKALELPPEDEAAILGGTAARLYGL